VYIAQITVISQAGKSTSVMSHRYFLSLSIQCEANIINSYSEYYRKLKLKPLLRIKLPAVTHKGKDSQR